MMGVFDEFERAMTRERVKSGRFRIDPLKSGQRETKLPETPHELL
jgi:hypothetical protein